MKLPFEQTNGRPMRLLSIITRSGGLATFLSRGPANEEIVLNLWSGPPFGVVGQRFEFITLGLLRQCFQPR
jgi:hypothetical protein